MGSCIQGLLAKGGLEGSCLDEVPRHEKKKKKHQWAIAQLALPSPTIIGWRVRLRVQNPLSHSVFGVREMLEPLKDVKNPYQILSFPSSNLYLSIWMLLVHFLLLISSRCLIVVLFVVNVGVLLVNWCWMCRADEENIDHLFLHCTMARELWDAVLTLFGRMVRHQHWNLEGCPTLGMYSENHRITIGKNNDQKTQEKKWKSINQ